MPRAAAAQPETEILETEYAIVYPVEGTYLSGIPHVPTITVDAIAERLVRTGAFRYEAPELAADEQPNEIVVQELAEDALAGLDFYDPPPAVAAEIQPEGPADAGLSDSPEV